ncbi:MAG: ribosomal protein S18-alanine N-acetyltransferase [candidate division Zixibacteria bacterium]|nr:ribosomal protein S18-alanine N-acetyltransferase [candidate division Zixibacteria bacterium]
MLLAVDSSSARLKLGLADEAVIHGNYVGPADRSHSEKIIGELDKLLVNANISPAQLDGMAVITGPGSFTGLRVGTATLIGLAQAWNKEIIAGSTTVMHHLFLAGGNSEALVVIHCRADQFFVSTAATEVEILNVSEITSRYPEALFGGPGAEKLQELVSKAGGHALRLAAPSSYDGGQLAALFTANRQGFAVLDPADVQINYLVKSQPERKRDQESFEIVEMAPADLNDIMRIEAESFSDAWKEKNFRADIDNPDVITLAVRRGKQCIGYAVCVAVDAYGYISNIATAREYRSEGIGKALLDELFSRLRRLKKRQLLLDVRPSNVKAVEFYQSYGFSILMRRKDFYSSPVEDSYTMSMEILY